MCVWLFVCFLFHECVLRTSVFFYVVFVVNVMCLCCLVNFFIVHDVLSVFVFVVLFLVIRLYV